MPSRPTLSRRAARWSLLLAVVLQFGGAVLGPYWHYPGSVLAGAPIVDAQGGEDSGIPVPQHDEQTCLVCQSVTATGLLPSPSVLPFSVVVDDRELVAPAAAFQGAHRSSARARAPPFA